MSDTLYEGAFPDDALSEVQGPPEVHFPSHYTQGRIECIDAIASALGQAGYVDFLRGQVIKYVWRLGLKGPGLTDAEKALYYAERLVEQLKDYS